MEKLLAVASGVTMTTFRASAIQMLGGGLEMIKWWEAEVLPGTVPAW